METTKQAGWIGSVSAGKDKSKHGGVSRFAPTQAELYAMLRQDLEELKVSAKRCKPETWFGAVNEGAQEVYPNGMAFLTFRLHLGTELTKERRARGRDAVIAMVEAGPFNNSTFSA